MPIATMKSVPKDFLEQMKSNVSKNRTETENPAAESAAQEVHTEINTVSAVKTASDKKEKYADVINIRLSKGRRNEIKTFCSSCGISVTQYIESSYEFLAKEVAAGNIVISKGGISKVEH